MSVVAEQSGELYALLVDQVSEVMSLPASAFERNPPTLEPAWAEFSTGIYRLEDRLLVVLNVAKLLAQDVAHAQDRDAAELIGDRQRDEDLLLRICARHAFQNLGAHGSISLTCQADTDSDRHCARLESSASRWNFTT
ncbi:MAG: chemotaxis protein CheW [Rhodospirillales bacterium]|nr:chemotaxis protein CheW [Rhodospirillales bacterium]